MRAGEVPGRMGPMRSGMWVAHLLGGLVLCAAICGCVGLGGRDALTSDRVPARPKPTGFRENVPDLRIPGDTLAMAAQAPEKDRATTSDIPLVPVPLPPLGGNGKGKTQPAAISPPPITPPPQPAPAPALPGGRTRTPR